MKKIITLLFIFALSMNSNAAADSIFMKDGSVKKGDIIRENEFSYTIESDGQKERVFKDQVESVAKSEEVEEPSELMKTLNAEGFVSDYEMTNPEELTDDKKKLILSLLEINGTLALLESNKNDLLKKVPGDQYRTVEELINIDELVEQIVPIFAKHYSLEDLKSIVDFYQSSAGQKVINTTPTVMQEVVQASVLYFQKRLKNK